MVDFKEGDKIELMVGNHIGTMAARPGATAIVTGPSSLGKAYISIIWHIDNPHWHEQSDGSYAKNIFRNLTARVKNIRSESRLADIILS